VVNEAGFTVGDRKNAHDFVMALPACEVRDLWHSNLGRGEVVDVCVADAAVVDLLSLLSCLFSEGIIVLQE
jgi:hypothetical protein